MKKYKVLIIKTGYSEVLDKESNSRKASLGDILRTTVLLHLFKEDHVTWVTDESALPLLENNPYIDRLLPYDFTTILQLEAEDFDIIINLEKILGICALTEKLKAWKKLGFRFDRKTGKAEAYDKASEVLAVGSDAHVKKENNQPFQELLFEMIGKKWNKENYILGYKSETKETYDIGLNTRVGQKWPTKAWSKENWDLLEKTLIEAGFSVSRQDKQDSKILTNLYYYMDWINSCKFIISNDSLGMHLAIALKKKVLGLFGSTPYKEVYFYGNGKAILPDSNLECMPCFKGVCKKGKNCIESITVEKVYKEIQNMLNNDNIKQF